MRRTMPILLAGTLLAACSPKAEEGAAAPAATAAAPAPPPSVGGSSDGGAIAPVSPHGSPRGAEGVVTANGRTLSTPGFAFDLPEGWKSEQPSSSMRLAQAVVPGDGGPGELVLFYFGPGQGGTVEGNFERWRGQVEGGAEPRRGTLESGGFRISWIDLAGTLLPSGMGSGPTTPQPGFRLIGAVAEGESGPYFFKLTGPEATIAKQRDAFLALLTSCRRPA